MSSSETDEAGSAYAKAYLSVNGGFQSTQREAMNAIVRDNPSDAALQSLSGKLEKPVNRYPW